MKTHWIAGVSLAGAVAGGAVADTPQDDTMSALLQEVATLRERVAELEGTEDRAAETRREEIRAIVSDALADADSRSSLLQSGATAGHDGRFFLASSDGNFRLGVTGQLQLRFISSLQDNTGDGTGDDTVSGFENTRTRFGFVGHVVDPSWKYFIWGGWNGSGGTILLEANATKDFGNGWSVTAGQFKLPTWQEWTVSETRQQFVERSVLDARFSQVYGQGVKLSYAQDNVRAHFAFSDGLRHFNGPFNAQAATGRGFDLATEFALTGRVEWLLGGEWSNDYSGFRGDEVSYVLGGGIHYQRDEYGNTGVGNDETEVVEFNIDANLQFDGANVFAAIIYRSLDDDNMVDRDELGVMVQGGYFIADDLELIARYEYGDLDGAGGAAGDDLNILTVGATKYWARHALKWTNDVGIALDPVDGAWFGGSRGFRADSADEDGQVVIRSQLQVLF